MLIDFIYSLHSYQLRMLINVTILLILLVGTSVFIRWCPTSEDDSDAVIGLSAAVSFMYAIFLGFVIFSSVNNLEQAESSADTESQIVSMINYEASFLPLTLHVQTKKILREYLDKVINQEWPAMQKGAVNTSAIFTVRKLQLFLLHHRPIDNDRIDATLWTDLVSRSNNLYQEHQKRISFSQHLSLSTGLWYCLIVSTIIMLISNLFYYFKDRRAHVILLCCIGIVTGLLLYLEVSINFPYRGYYGVTPASFVQVLQNLNQW